MQIIKLTLQYLGIRKKSALWIFIFNLLLHGICIICTFLSSCISLDPAQNKSYAAISAQTRIFSLSVSTVEGSWSSRFRAANLDNIISIFLCGVFIYVWTLIWIPVESERDSKREQEPGISLWSLYKWPKIENAFSAISVARCIYISIRAFEISFNKF